LGHPVTTEKKYILGENSQSKNDYYINQLYQYIIEETQKHYQVKLFV